MFRFEKQLELKLLSFVLKINENMAKREFPSSFLTNGKLEGERERKKIV